MSTAKSTVTKAVAAVMALSAAGAVSAAITDTPSDLFIAVWNPATSVSFVQDLGAGFSNANLNGSFNTAGFTTSFSVDGGSLSSAIGTGTYTFVLFAGDETQDSTRTCGGLGCTYFGDSFFYSQATGGPLQALQNSTVFVTAGSEVVSYVNSNQVGTAGFTASENHTAASQYWASADNAHVPGPNFQIGNFTGSASGAAGLNLVKYLATSTNDAGADPTTPSWVGSSAGHGVFTLNDSNGLLSYAAPAGVPLPAAGWLLLSGLLGLGAIGHRTAGRRPASGHMLLVSSAPSRWASC